MFYNSFKFNCTIYITTIYISFMSSVKSNEAKIKVKNFNKI